MCHSQLHSPKGIASCLLRVSFGLSLVFVGVTHYRDTAGFLGLVTAGFPPALAQVAMVWGYVLPGLMILGGLLFAVGVWKKAGTWIVGVALGSIPAGMLLKSALGGVDLSQTMPAAVNAWVWLLVYGLAVRSWGGMKSWCACDMSGCESQTGVCDCGPGCNCDQGSCGCGDASCGCEEEKKPASMKMAVKKAGTKKKGK